MGVPLLVRRADPANSEEKSLKGISVSDLATEYGVNEDIIRIALASMRTPVSVPRRKTLNVGLAAYRFIIKEQRPNEPIWQTVDRVFTELEQRRARKNMRRKNRFY
jgi:hypothetical protein